MTRIDGMTAPESSKSPTSSENTPEADESRNNDVETLAPIARTETQVHQFWKFKLRPDDDGEPQDWWFASTAIPLIAATSGPLANVMSIAALITTWRVAYDPENPGADDMAVQRIPDPRWCIALNAASLACGFIGNIFLLFNFTRRVRYIVALPATIILWYCATGILMAITISMNKYVPPHRDDQTYSQGFWHAIIAAVLYLVSSMLLMVNMQGYFFGHYPQHFELTDEQRNLILQSMMFFIWLAGGAGIFARVEGWSFVDSLYFCDVTILTVGFGDLHPNGDVGRGLVFPYAVGGIIILGLMVSSIAKFARDISHDNIIKQHIEKRRTNTLNRSTTMHGLQNNERHFDPNHPPQISAPFNGHQRSSAVTFDPDRPNQLLSPGEFRQRPRGPVHTMMRPLKQVRKRKPRLLLLEEEKDRFQQMRRIQHGTNQYKQYSALTMSVIAFAILWCGGAVGFWQAEKNTQGLSYFEALYFCYVSLLTIGYGDLSPTSNAGKPFFIVWSLVAVPTMTILISDMGDTVIAKFKEGTFTLADWTVLPKEGLYRAFLDRHPWLLRWMQNQTQKEEREKRLAEGFPVGDRPEIDRRSSGMSRLSSKAVRIHPTLEDLANEPSPTANTLARYLALAIRAVADDLSCTPPKTYRYEEWVEYTRLIRFSKMKVEEVEEEEQEEGLIEWDWLGKDSPMMSESSEAAWLLDRLCESLERYMRKQEREDHHKQGYSHEGEGDGTENHHVRGYGEEAHKRQHLHHNVEVMDHVEKKTE